VKDAKATAPRQLSMPRLAPATMVESPRAKVLDDLRQALRAQKFGKRTERTYCHWVVRYIYFHDLRHPVEMGEDEVNAFLTHLWVKEKVGAATQNEALSALLFLYRYVIGHDLGCRIKVIRARRSGPSPKGDQEESA
jgi:hypothetical protein